MNFIGAMRMTDLRENSQKFPLAAAEGTGETGGMRILPRLVEFFQSFKLQSRQVAVGMDDVGIGNLGELQSTKVLCLA